MSEPFDPAEWAVLASGTEDGQRQIACDQAAAIIGQPLIYILGVLFDLGLLGTGMKYEIPVTTPSQKITVTVTAESRTEGM